MLSARRILTIVGLIGVVGVSAAGCGTTAATSAAQVGDVSISEAAIFDRTTAVVNQAQTSGAAPVQPATLAVFNRAQTTAAIRSQLLEVAADDRGVVVTNDQVNTAMAGGQGSSAASQLGAPESAVEQTVRDLLRLEGLISQQPPQGSPVTNVTVRIDGVSVPTREEAVATRSQFLADPAGVDTAIAASSTPVQPQTVSVLKNPTVGSTGVFNAAQGDVIVYPSQDGLYVIRILERTVEPAVLTAADLAPQQLLGKFDLGALLLAPYANQAGVSVNPRLGVWDPLTVQVVPGGSGL